MIDCFLPDAARVVQPVHEAKSANRDQQDEQTHEDIACARFHCRFKLYAVGEPPDGPARRENNAGPMGAGMPASLPLIRSQFMSGAVRSCEILSDGAASDQGIVEGASRA